MESPSKFTDDFLTCGICFEIFQEPKILTCLHTFCKRCLSSYITATSIVQNRTGFHCPTCREVTIPPYPERSDWASQFRNNFYVSNLIDANLNVPEPNASASTDQKLCSNHHSVLDLFCVDCDKTVCVKCSVVSHRSCRQIIPIYTIAQEKRSMLLAYASSLDDQLSRMSKVLTELEREKQNIDFQKHIATEIIKDKSKTIMKYVADEMAAQLAKLEQDTHEWQVLLDKEFAQRITLKQSILKISATMNNKIRAPDSFIFDGLNDVLTQRINLMKEIPAQYDIPVYKINFNPNHNCDSISLLGHIERTYERRKLLMHQDTSVDLTKEIAWKAEVARSDLSSLAFTDKSSLSRTASPFIAESKQLEMISELNSKIKKDKSKPSLRDITVVSGNVMVVTDYANNCVKSFYRHGTEYKESHVSVGAPHAVAKISDNQVAITLPKAKQIALINVHPDLILEKLIKTPKKYWGVTNIGKNSLAVSTCPGMEPGEIDIIDTNGNCIRNILPSSKGIISNPMYLTSLTNGDIVASDCTLSKVIKLRQNGDLLFGQDRSSKTFSRPMGMDCDAFDAILVVDEENLVVVLTEDGEIVKRYSLRSEAMKKRTIRSIAIADNKLYIITDVNYILTFQLT